MKRVLFAGDINVDVIMGGLATPPVLDKEITCRTYDVTMGGSTGITACAYASLGGRASIAGLVGKDGDGDFTLALFRSFGVRTRLVARTRRVRTGVTVNLIVGNARSQVTYAGTLAEFDAAALGDATLRGFDHLHVSGPYLQTRLLPRIAPLLGRARRLGLSTSLDPQWDSTERWEGMSDWLPLLTWLFLNVDEALSLARARSRRGALRTLSARTNCAVMKAGKDGAFVAPGGRIVSIPAPPKKVVDTTGAGDSFNAGFLFAALEKNMPLVEAARFAAAAGARSCMFAGGVNARSTYRDVLAMMKKNR